MTTVWSKLVDAAPEEAEHLGARARVEVAGGLVGEDDLGSAGQGARTRHPLLLAAGELARAVAQTVAQADRVDDGVEPLLVGLAAGDVQGQRDVLQRGQRRHQVERLEDEADAVAAQLGEPLVVERGQLGVADVDRAGGGGVETGDTVHEGRLAGAGRPHDRGELAAGEVDGDAVEGADLRVAFAVDLARSRRALAEPWARGQRWWSRGSPRASASASSLGNVGRPAVAGVHPDRTRTPP